MQPERVTKLNDESPACGTHVLYWMQQSQRASGNYALEYALGLANERGEPLLVGFGLTDRYPEANLRHYAFMLDGLAEVARTLADRGIGFVLRLGEPAEVAIALAQEASIVVCDAGHLRPQRAWRADVAAGAGRLVIEVEADLVVPLPVASQKAEHAARTLRPKILAVREAFLAPVDEGRVARPWKAALPSALDPAAPEALLATLSLDRSVAPAARFVGGTSHARAQLEGFIAQRLDGYVDGRNEPIARACSELSPYLHFGQIGALEVALAAVAAREPGDENRRAFLEELIVRRELAQNYVRHTPAYDRWDGIPAWSRATLDKHREDRRAHLYDQGELERGATHDRYWNAAMREMRLTGYMHNYMRMYWGKKVLEWSPDAATAHGTLLAINNKYFLDGRDASSFSNVGWIFGLHDRPWAERPIFGTVRYMNDKGLERKLDIEAYVAWANALTEDAPPPPPRAAARSGQAYSRDL